MQATFANLPALLLFAVASSITPGPNNIMLMASGANFGFRRSLPHFLGVDVGFGVLIASIGLGLAGVLARAPALLAVLKVIGAAYLLFLAWRIARSAAPQAGEARGEPMSFLQAVAFQWVNPKAWLGALTGIVTFAVPASLVPSVVGVAAVMAIVNLPCAALWTGCGTALRGWLARPGRLAVFNHAMAALLVASLYPMLRA